MQSLYKKPRFWQTLRHPATLLLLGEQRERRYFMVQHERSDRI